MPRRYRLRLGDGTVLMVDQDGLNTWRMDDKAMVLGAGGKWHPLKDVLARQQAALKYASQQDPSAPVPPPVIHPKPREDEPPRVEAAASSQQKSIARPALPLTPPPKPSRKPPREPADEESPIIPSNPLAEDGAPRLSEAVSQSEPPNLEAWADEPAIPSTESFPRPSTPGDEAPPILDTFSQSEPPRLATGESLDLRALAEESFSQPSPPVEVEEVTAIPATPLEDEAPELPAPSPWHDPVEASPVAARPSLQALADDPAPRAGYTREPPAFDDGLPSIQLKPAEPRDEEYAHASTRPGVYEREPEAFVERRPRGQDLEAQFVLAVKAFGNFLSWSLEHLGHVYRRLQPMIRDALARLPKVRATLREALVKWRAARSSRSVQKPPPSLDATPEVQVVTQEPTEWPALVSSPSVPRKPPPSLDVTPEVQVLAQEPTEWRGEETGRRAIAGEELPVIRLEPVTDYAAPLRAIQKLLRRFGSGASAWAVGLKGRVERLARRYRPEPSRPWSEPEAPSAPYWAPREPLKAPPSTSELPVLRLAEIHEPEEVEHIYEGRAESLFPTAWLWTKRIVLITGLVAGVIVAGRTWGNWFPKAAHLGGTAITEMNEYIQSREQRERERQALQEATEQLPHLAPDAIRLVLSRSPTGVLDPPEAFQAACDAADRGLSALTPAERRELKALRSALLATLSHVERERVLEYDQVRARRTPFEFEDRSALELFARGARALPSDNHERLRKLFGKAIAAGLAPPIKVAPRGAAKR